MIKYEELIRSLKQGKVLPLYLLYGDEEFLIQESVDLIISAIVDPASRDFNFNMVYCKGTSGNEIVNLCQTLPFMAERRLVIAREVEALKAADVEELVAYLQSPSPGTCLVMISNQSRYEKKPVIAAVEASGAVVRFYALLDRDLQGWIESWARKRGLTIHRDAVQYVWQTLGNDLQAVSNELEKTAISLKGRKNVTYDDVKSVVGDFRDYSPFDLADAVCIKDRERALLVLSRLIQEGEQPVGLLGSLSWNFRRLLSAKAMEASGAEFEEIKKKHRVIFHQAAAFRKQMESYTTNELRNAFEVLVTADRTLKSSGLSGRLVLERMILRLCGT
jgi:DNA polymerase III subunit delta